MNRLSTCMSKLSLGCPGLRISYYNDGISYLDDNLFSLLFLFSSVSSAYSLSSRSNLFIRYSFFFCFFSCSAILNLSFSSFSTFDLYYLSSSYFSNLSFSSYSAFILCCFYYSSFSSLSFSSYSAISLISSYFYFYFYSFIFSCLYRSYFLFYSFSLASFSFFSYFF